MRPELDDLAVAHDGDQIGQRHRLFLVVRHEDAGRAELEVEVLDLGAHPAAQGGVEVAERLVEQEDRGLLDERPAERHALLLAARELARLAAQEMPDVEHVGDRGDPRLDLVLGPVLQLQAEGDVVERRHVRIERVVLEHHRHPPLVGRRLGDVLARRA